MKVLQVLILLISFGTYGQVNRSLDTILMGSSYSFTAISESEELTGSAIRSAVNEVVRIEKLISSWDHQSETSEINRNAGVKPIKVSFELFELIRRSKRVSKLSNGCFDISYASMDRIWNFENDTASLPSESEIRTSIEKVGYENILLNKEDTSVFLVEEGMKIGFGAIGKGYAAEKAKLVMQSNGAISGVVNAGGDLIAWGVKDMDETWKVGIQDPNHKDQILMWIPAMNTSVVTSGNYEKFMEIEGTEYCHIINPKTGWPAKNLRSVTIICSNAELSDALATTVFVLGTTDGIALINKLEGVECVIVDDQNKIHFSNNIESNIAANEL